MRGIESQSKQEQTKQNMRANTNTVTHIQVLGMTANSAHVNKRNSAKKISENPVNRNTMRINLANPIKFVDNFQLKAKLVSHIRLALPAYDNEVEH